MIPRTRSVSLINSGPPKGPPEGRDADDWIAVTAVPRKNDRFVSLFFLAPTRTGNIDRITKSVSWSTVDLDREFFLMTFKRTARLLRPMSLHLAVSRPRDANCLIASSLTATSFVRGRRKEKRERARDRGSSNGGGGSSRLIYRGSVICDCNFNFTQLRGLNGVGHLLGERRERLALVKQLFAAKTNNRVQCGVLTLDVVQNEESSCRT